MARIARLVIPGIPHHVTQRGNNRKQVFFSSQDHLLYLQLFKDYAERYHLSLTGYCLMPNHVHLIVIPHEADSLARTLGRTHADYARAANIHARTTGAEGEAEGAEGAVGRRAREFRGRYTQPLFSTNLTHPRVRGFAGFV